jgi:hypothetical protein
MTKFIKIEGINSPLNYISLIKSLRAASYYSDEGKNTAYTFWYDLAAAKHAIDRLQAGQIISGFVFEHKIQGLKEDGFIITVSTNQELTKKMVKLISEMFDGGES